jgi:exocyst complex component 2
MQVLHFRRLPNESYETRKWQVVDHDLEESVAGAILSPTGGGVDIENDPLGLGNIVR